MAALAQRAQAAQQSLVDMYCFLENGTYSHVPTLETSISSFTTNSNGISSTSITSESVIDTQTLPANSIGLSSTRSSTPWAASVTSDLGPSIGEQTDNEETTTDSNSSMIDEIEMQGSMKLKKVEEFCGTLHRWAVDKVTGEDKNFGFIRCPKLKKEIFVHESSLSYPDMAVPSEVIFCISEDQCSKRKSAINVRLSKGHSISPYIT